MIMLGKIITTIILCFVLMSSCNSYKTGDLTIIEPVRYSNDSIMVFPETKEQVVILNGDVQEYVNTYGNVPLYRISKDSSLLYVYDINNSMLLFDVKKRTLINKISISRVRLEPALKLEHESDNWLILQSDIRFLIFDRYLVYSVSVLDSLKDVKPFCEKTIASYSYEIENDSSFLVKASYKISDSSNTEKSYHLHLGRTVKHFADSLIPCREKR